MKRLLIIGGGCLILLLAYFYVVPGLSPKPTYVMGFPEEKSKGRTDLLLHYGTLNAAQVTNQTEEVNETSRLGAASPKSTVYESITDDGIDEHFQPIFGSKDDGKQFSALTDTLIDQFEGNEQVATEKGYPAVTIEDNNTMTITTKLNEKNMDVADLLSEYGKKGSDFFTLDVERANEEAFIVSVYFSSSRVQDVYHLFITQDLSSVEVVSGEGPSIAEEIATGALDDFTELLFQAEINERYAILFGGYGIYDRKDKTIQAIKEADKLCNDGKYVYINGEDSAFTQGEQQIQHVEDYLAGTNENRTSFHMNFKQIAKEFGLTAVSSTSTAKLIYFNEEYLMYTFSFNALLFGSAGNVNVIVDRQNNTEDPTLYLFNFRISQ